MIDLLLNKTTKDTLDRYLKAPSLPLLLVGDRWQGTTEVSKYLATKLLQLPENKLDNYPYFHLTVPVDNKAIGIESIRQIESYLRLKVPSNKEINRVIVINEADKLTIEAQNALLKNLEEPPEATVFILSSSLDRQLLPTIVSRVQTIKLSPLSEKQLTNYFIGQGYNSSQVSQALKMSGGRPMLMKLLLEDSDNPLVIATKLAKETLSGTTFNRLNLVNDLTKDKGTLDHFIFIIKEMALIGCSSTDPAMAKRWKNILSSTLNYQQKVLANSQSKLALTDFMLSLR